MIFLILPAGNKMCIGINIFTDGIEHFTIGAFPSADKNYDIMFLAKALRCGSRFDT